MFSLCVITSFCGIFNDCIYTYLNGICKITEGFKGEKHTVGQRKRKGNFIGTSTWIGADNEMNALGPKVLRG